MKKIGIIGHFAFDQNLAIGQTVKVENLYKEIKSRYEDNEIILVDTFNWSHRFIQIVSGIIKLFFSCKNVVISISEPALEKIYFIIYPLNRLLKRKIHFVVVGGDLSEILSKRKKWINRFSEFVDCFYVETETMQNKMRAIGIYKTEVMFNFKKINIISNEGPQEIIKPLRICTFSRVNKEKGITDIIDVVSAINREHSSTIFQLDIFGTIEESYESEFETLLKRKGNNGISYCGIVESDLSSEILKNYFCLIFPTKYKTEGFPGTIIDAYSAGLPVIASKWQYWHDLIDENKTGLVYEMDDIDGLREILDLISINPSIIDSMKSECINRSKMYLPENAILPLISNLV